MRYTIKTLLILGLVIIAAFSITGCDTAGTTNNVSTPSSGTVQPTGTLRGVLLDRVTNEPIVGAVVDLGVQKATTDTTGGFTMYNVPATTDPAGTGGVVGKYLVTIDLRKVTSPISMIAPTSAVKYPQFSFATVQVKYSSLNDAGNDTAGTTSTSNHDTVITGLVSSLPLEVGKLAANISGSVAYSGSLQKATDTTWTVLLVSTSSSDFCSTPSCWADMPFDTTVGHHEGIIAKVTTAAGDSSFAFNNIETLTQYKIVAWDDNQTFFGEEMVMAPADGATKMLLIQNSDNACVGLDCANTKLDNRTVLVGPVDAIKPRIISAAPETGSDLLASSVTVTYVFSEPIKMDAYNNGLTPSSTTGIFYDVIATDNGVKAGNIAHTLSWNAAGDVLVVTLPSLAPSHKYTVTIAAALPKLFDASNNAAEDPAGLASVEFTTSGGATATAPASVVDLRKPQDWQASVQLDWLPASGAKKYNVYKRIIQWPNGTAQYGQWDRLGPAGQCYTTTLSEFFDSGSLVEAGAIPLAIEYSVYGVNSDCIESSGRATLSVKDEVGPAISDSFPSLVDYVLSLLDSDNVIRIHLTEPLDETAAKVMSNYTIQNTGFNVTASFAAPNSLPTNVVYVMDSNSDGQVDATDTPYVDLSLTKAFQLTDLKQATINSGVDGICNTTKALPDNWRTYATTYLTTGGATLNYTTSIGVGQGQPHAICVQAVGTALASTPCDANGDGAVDATETANCTAGGIGDIVVNIGTTANPTYAIINDNSGICHTARRTGVNTDSQLIQVNAGSPNSVCIEAGTDLFLDSQAALGGDDTIVRYPLVTLGSGIKDVAGNSARSGFTSITTDGFTQ